MKSLPQKVGTEKVSGFVVKVEFFNGGETEYGIRYKLASETTRMRGGKSYRKYLKRAKNATYQWIAPFRSDGRSRPLFERLKST